MKEKDYRTPTFKGVTVGIALGILLGVILGPDVGLAAAVVFGLIGFFIGRLLEKRK